MESAGTQIPRLDVAWMTGAAHFELAMRSIKTFAKYNKDDCKFYLMGDGSLTHDHVERLQNEFSDFQIILFDPEHTRDKREAILRGRKNLAKHYSACPMAMKIVDVPAMFSSPFLYVDSDVLFVKPFSLGNVRHGQRDVVFMDGLYNAYSPHTTWQVAKQSFVIPYVDNFNAGFYYLKSNDWIDFDLCDRIAGFPAFWNFLPHLEQTYWAAIAAKNIAKSGMFSNQQVCFPRFDKRSQPEAVAFHYAGSRRNLLPKEDGDLVSLDSPSIQELNILPARRYQIFRTLVRGAKRRLTKNRI